MYAVPPSSPLFPYTTLFRSKLRIQPHPYFRREGNNVVLEVPLSLPEAVLGTTVEVPALDGSRLHVKVPSGASSGARLRDRKSTRLNSSHVEISYAVFCLKKK